MTNEEAIKMLEYIRYTGNGENEYRGCAQGNALDMAIKALEQQPCEDAPSAQPKMGHWINKKPRWIPSLSMTMHDAYECSNCGEPGVHWWKHCINCGVRMIEPQESEKE